MKYQPNAPAHPSETDTRYHLSLTTREWLIGQALQGVAGNRTIGEVDAAERAVRIVDKTLELLNADAP